MSASAPDPNQPQLMPTVSDPPDALTELSLLEQLADPSTLEPQRPDPTPLGRTYAYNLLSHRLMPDLAGGPLMLWGVDSLRQWIAKTLITERAAAPIYKRSDYGLQGASDIVDGSTFDQSRVAELQGLIRDALKQHPRIQDITAFLIEYTPGDDAAFVSFTVLVVGDGQDPLSIARYPIPAPASVGGNPNL